MFKASANLNLMIKAARQASRGLIRDFGEVENLQVAAKSLGDFVTKADLKAEEIIYSELTESRPHYGWLGEESSSKIGKDPTRRWIVDPLDGTTNYIHGIPHWSISIALEFKSEIISAVIYDPLRDELFVAEKGVGAWLNDRRLRVSNRKNLPEMLFSTGIPFGETPHLDLTLQEIEKLMPMCSGIRRNGSAALDLAYVSAGRFDAFWERNLNPWDIAAGILIVKEAGGFISSIGDDKSPIETGNIIASNTEIYKKFSSIISVT